MSGLCSGLVLTDGIASSSFSDASDWCFRLSSVARTCSRFGMVQLSRACVWVRFEFSLRAEACRSARKVFLNSEFFGLTRAARQGTQKRSAPLYLASWGQLGSF